MHEAKSFSALFQTKKIIWDEHDCAQVTVGSFLEERKKKSPTTGHMLNTFSVFWVVSPYHQYAYSYKDMYDYQLGG